MPRWVCVLDTDGAETPGVVARIAHVFAERGISLDEVLAMTWNDRPLVLVRFTATDRLRDYMMRRLKRIRAVTGVQVQEADDRPIWQYLDR